MAVKYDKILDELREKDGDSDEDRLFNGVYWNYTEIVSQDTDDTRVFLIQPKNNTAENSLVVSVSAGGDCTLEIFEKPTFSARGTELTPVNRNRNFKYNTKPKLRLFNTPTTSDDGTELFKQRLDEVMNRRIVLSGKYFYLVRVTSNADGNETSIMLDWYEEDV